MSRPFLPRAIVLWLGLAGTAQAQGLNATGVAGGLSIPHAQALGNGTLALGLGNPLEPQSVASSTRRVSYVLGLGLTPGLDLVGRFAEYSSRRPSDGYLADGRSDLSVNLKYSTALGSGTDATRIAVGANDIAGGEPIMFRGAYALVTQPWGPVKLSLGVGTTTGRQRALPGTRQPLDGVFGGVDYTIESGLVPGTLMLSGEYDARQALAGVRWTSPRMPFLAGSRFSASAHRTAERGAMSGHTAVAFFLAMPLGERGIPPSEDAVSAPQTGSVSVPDTATESAPARLGRLRSSLVGLGLELVRVGYLERHWVVEYQNRRYGHHELDAIGLVLGLAAQAAPAEVERIVVSALKTGQPVLTLSVNARAWRDFVRDGRAGALRESLQVRRGSGFDPRRVDWLSDQPGPASRLQVRLTPQLAYTVGTEFGAFDYSVALRASLSAPLWTGAQFVAHTQQRIAVSDQAGAEGVFASLRQAQGVQALALHQTLWMGRRAVVGGAVGVFEYDAPGVEGEALLFVPGRDDVVRLRGRQLERRPGMPSGGQMQQWASYRWIPQFGGWARDTWVEVGLQRYPDQSRGPLLTVSRWWGDFGAHLTYRRGGVRQYAGLELSFPLTPRAAPRSGPVQFLGASQWRTGLRTRLTDSNSLQNTVDPVNMRDFASAWDIELNSLDAGRLGERYVAGHLPRLREAYLALRPDRP